MGGEVNAGSRQHSWLFLLLVSTGSTGWMSPEAHLQEVATGSTACLVPTWIFAALLPTLPLSYSACSEDTFFPTSSQSYQRCWGWRRQGGKWNYCPLGCCSIRDTAPMRCPCVGYCRPMQFIKLILYMHCPTCATFIHQTPGFFASQGNSPIPRAAHNPCWPCKGRI